MIKRTKKNLKFNNLIPIALPLKNNLNSTEPNTTKHHPIETVVTAIDMLPRNETNLNLDIPIVTQLNITHRVA